MIPEEIRNMDHHSVALFNKALQDGTYKSRNIRVLVVGHYGVGKTTLVKRLLSEDFYPSSTNSTEGIDIYVGYCTYQQTKKIWEKTSQEQDPEKQLIKMLSRHKLLDDMKKCLQGNDEVLYERGNPEVSQHISYKLEKETEEKKQHLEYRKLLQSLIDEETETEDDISIEVWDFGGQGNFYPTHIYFLSYRSIYLLLYNASKRLDDVVDDKDLEPGERKTSTVRDFLSFWINTVKTYATGPEGERPTILLVGTHVDQIPEERRKQMIENNIESILKHFHEEVETGQLIVTAENVVGLHEDRCLELIQRAIVRTAESQPFWNEELPKSWLPFQYHLNALRQNGTKILATAQIFRIDRDLPVKLQKEGIEFCLRFLHSTGSLIYFAQEGLSDYVVLEPVILINTFRSLVTCEHFCSAEEIRKKAYKEMKQHGAIRRDTIDQIWQLPEFSTLEPYKEYLLKIMERLDLIAKPKIYQNGNRLDTDMFFIPAMAKNLAPTELISQFEGNVECMKMNFDFSQSFLPSAVFYRFISSCTCIWPLYQQRLYSGCCILMLNATHVLLVRKGKDQILLAISHARNRTAVNRSFVRNVVEVLMDNLNNVINLHATATSNAPFTLKGGCLENESPNEILTECKDNCKGVTKSVLEAIPTELELMRFSKVWFGAKDNLLSVALALGLESAEYERIEHDFANNLSLKVFHTFLKWRQIKGKRSTFRILTEACGCDVHILCKIYRADQLDKDAHETIPKDIRDGQCSDEMIDMIAVLVGKDYLHFGLEIGLKLSDIENIRDTKSLVDLCCRIMLLAREKKIGRSVISLISALLRMGNRKAFDDFVDEFVEREEEEIA